MKNDVKKLEKITDEMKINDIVFNIMIAEYSRLEKAIDYGNYYKIEDELDKAYFYRRVISVLESNDLPLAAAVGLFGTCRILNTLYWCRNDYIGESDTDADIFKMLLEFGYRQCDEMSYLGRTPLEIYNRLVNETEENDDDE